MPYVPQLQHSWEVRSVTDMISSYKAIWSAPPVKWSKSGPVYPTPFSVHPLLNPGLINAIFEMLCNVATNTGHVWLEGKWILVLRLARKRE